MEDWMRNCENLIGEDADGEACKLLTEFSEDDSPNSLLSRLDDFMEKAAPSQTLIDEVFIHLYDDVLITTVAKICSTWSTASVSVEAQRSIHEYTRLMDDKAQFLHCIFSKILQSGAWRHLHQSVYRAVNNILLAVIPVARQYPHNPTNLHETLLHFQIRPFLCGFSLTAWTGYGSHFDSPRLITKLPTELIVPTMRRLGMMDLLDLDWNMHGSWDEILTTMGRSGDEPLLSKVYSDNVLAEKSTIWKNSRNSIVCRKIRKADRPYLRHMPPAAQCFEYFSKCSVQGCSNIETAEKPHDHRCTSCYYFHFCSDACRQYADMFDLHDCDFTPPEKARDIKREMEAYLGLDKKKRSADNKHERCNFCLTKRTNAPRETLMQCTRCKSVAYCDRDCQAWDWPEHKGICKKK